MAQWGSGIAVSISALSMAVALGATVAVHRVERRLDAIDATLSRLESPADSGPTRVTLSVARGWRALGNPRAPVTVVEFTDYECPYCKRFHSDAYVNLKRNYVDAGLVRWVVRDLPLAIHGSAHAAAESARCAGAQGAFWQMHDALLGDSRAPDSSVIAAATQRLGLDADGLYACLRSHRMAAAVDADVAEATALRLDHTPAFVVAPSAKEKLDGAVILGAYPYARYAEAIDSLLKAVPKAESKRP
jgi:protein-disulfide isomerase